ncbi:MAG: hypothetical protein K1X53_14635 [Candidatus Sumerlaeaceae bacterium]|nr:hypothetical protein [Candidatus Sumerlaeaceae bacterium]
MAHFQLPLDLPHAGTCAQRIIIQLDRMERGLAAGDQPMMTVAMELLQLLLPFKLEGENPVDSEAYRIRDEAAALGRKLVDEMEKLSVGADRLGQCVRNLFECLELGEEGAQISLRAGENPDSPQRPV